jgi:predicted transcriptional regulator
LTVLAALFAERGPHLILAYCLFLGTAIVPKRERTEIISAILAAAGDGVTAKTRLMYKTNLDTRAIKKYLGLLTEKGFLRDEGNDDGHSSYHLTEEGRRFLERSRELDGMLLSKPSEAPRARFQSLF